MPTSYTTLFGGQSISPSQLFFQQLALTTDVELSWPVEIAVPGASLFSDVCEVTSDQANRVVTFPDARQGPEGAEMVFNNVGAFTVLVNDNTGVQIGAVPSGEAWYFYLADNAAQAGVWRTFQFGTGVSSAVAAALVGAGLKAIVNTLNVKIAPTLTAVTPTNILDADRAELFVWTGGMGAFNLPSPIAAGSDWFVYVRNGGTGTLTVTPAAGLVNGAADLELAPGDSAIFVSDGANYYTVGFGQSVVGLFDYTSINVAGSGDYTLAGGELNRISYQFTGVLTGNRNVIVPPSVQQYWVDNATSGAFTLTVKTALGTGVAVQQGFAMIVSSDGTNVRAWEGTPAAGLLPVQRGSTGQATVAQGDLLYGSAVDVWSKLAKSAVATRYLANTGAANSPQWDQINLANGVTGDLPYANLAQGSPLSVLGVAGTIVADNAPIVALAANQVFRNNQFNTGVGWGPIRLDDNTNAVTNVLDETNGGTGQATYADGDMLYANAVNTLTKLTATATFKALLNTGGGAGRPAWDSIRFEIGNAITADETLVLTDEWTFRRHSSGSPHTLTIPTNASVAFDIGTVIYLDNIASSGTLTVAPDSGVTLDAQGQSFPGTGGATVLAGFKAFLVKVNTNTWTLLTDSPPAAGVDALYAGYVDATAAAEQVPAGWSVTNPGTGHYVVTHNLGLATANDMSIVAQIINTADDDFIDVTPGTNAFDVYITDSGSGNVNRPWFFLAKRNV